MAQLEAACSEALNGLAQMVTLAGEPGIGKTRTALELTTFAESQGAQVLWGRCYEEEGVPPYWPWVQSIRSHVQRSSAQQLTDEMGPGAAMIAEIVPEVRFKLDSLATPLTIDPELARFRLFDSVATFFRNAARNQPLVLVLDDLQWADHSSLQLLQFLVREMAPPQSTRLLVVGCYRDLELSRQPFLSETLAQLSRSAGSGFQRVILRGLDLEDTATFIETSAGFSPAPGLAEALFAHTEGNPFFMTEAIRLLAERGELTANHIGTMAGLKLPDGVRDVIGQRLSRLSTKFREVLTTAALIGRGFDLRLLGDLNNNLTRDQLQDVLEEAASFHLIEVVTGQLDRYQFTHSLIQETLAGELTASNKALLHARISEALEKLYGDNPEAHASELAFHFEGAQTLLGNEKLVRYSLMAGEKAIGAYAHEEALPHFLRAAAGKEGLPMDSETASILFGLGRSQLATLGQSQVVEAMGNLEKAFEFYAITGDVERAAAVAEHPTPTFGVHRTGVGERVTRALAMVVPDSLPAGRLLAMQGRILGQEAGDYRSATDAFRRALVISKQLDDPALELRSLANASFVDFFHCRWRECLEKAPRIIELAKKVDDPHGELITHLAGAFVELFMGNLSAARQHVADGMPIAEKVHDRFSQCGILVRSASASSVEGDWQSARNAIDRGLALLPNDPRLLNDRALLEFQVGNFDTGDAYMARFLEAMQGIEPGPSIEFALIAASLPLISRIKGEPYHLDIAADAADAVLSSSGVQFLLKGIVRSGLALRAVDEGNVALATKSYMGIKPLQGGLIGGGNLTSADYVLGLLSNTMGDSDLAVTHFEDALAFCRKAGYWPELAWCCYGYADSLISRNKARDRSKARSLLNESLAICNDLGMKPLAKHATSQLDRVQALPAISTHPAGLSEREVEILRLLAAGHSNRVMAAEMVLSVRTVERHIANIYGKTDSHSRAEATAFAYTSGLISST